MFVVLSDALPRNWLLFEASGTQYVAHFSDGMDARIAVGNEIISLAQLKQTGKIQKRGASWVLPLDERSRGKITLADMTIVDAIASAGGFTGIAAKNSVNLRREVAGKIETHIYPVADITEGRSQNVMVLPGDVLVIDERVF